MGKHDSSGRGFIWSSHAWYAEAADCKHKISFGLYHKDGGTTGEMEMVWHEIGSEWVPRLECFDDGWSVLFMFTDLLEEMAMFDGVNVTEEGFVNLLERCQFADMTPYERE